MKPWKIFIDGLSCLAKQGVGVHVVINKGEEHDYAIKLAFKTTTNKAKYEALFFSLTIARYLGIEKVQVQADSQVVVNQVWGEFAVKSEKLKKCLTLVVVECSYFKHFQIQEIPRAEN